jgi:hypothetical protein
MKEDDRRVVLDFETAPEQAGTELVVRAAAQKYGVRATFRSYAVVQVGVRLHEVAAALMRTARNGTHPDITVLEEVPRETPPKWRKLTDFGLPGGIHPKPQQPPVEGARPFKRGSFFPPETLAGRKFNRPQRKYRP